jgi:hypothetical protein
VSVDVAAALPNALLADVVCTVFGGEGKAVATGAVHAANRSASACGVCDGKGLLENVLGSESNGRNRKFSLCGEHR